MNSKSGPGRLNEKAFAKLVQERLIDTAQVREILGLKTSTGVYHRITFGHLTGPVIVQPRGYALWDRVQVEREAAAMREKNAA